MNHLRRTLSFLPSFLLSFLALGADDVMQFLRRHIYLMRRGEESAQQEIGVCRSVGRSALSSPESFVIATHRQPSYVCQHLGARSVASSRRDWWLDEELDNSIYETIQHYIFIPH